MLSILSSLQLKAEAVASASACITALETAQEKGAPYDLVLMDWLMPGMNGLNAVRTIRANSRIAQTLTFIMVTAHSREELLTQAQDIKLDGLLEKPVSPSSVLDAIMNALSGQSSGLLQSYERQYQTDDTADQLQGAQILLVEDNDTNQELAVDILTGVYALVDVAKNGVEAITMISKKDYDVVLMDCQMPVMDGYEATRQIRKDSRFADLPILAMSANAMAGDREECLAAGMNDSITKPIDIDLLLKTLARWIKPKHSLSTTPPKAQTALIDLPGIDADTALKRLHGNTTQYQKLLSMFYERQADVVDHIRSALHQGERDEALRLAHTLKRLADNIGANALVAAAEKLELGIKQGNDTHFETLLAQLAIPMDELLKALEEFLSVR